MAKDSELIIKGRVFTVGDEKLWSVLVLATVSHAQDTSLVVSEVFNDFIFEGNTVNWLATFARAAGITCLDDEPFDITVDYCPFVIIWCA